MTELHQIQSEVAEWSTRNFGQQPSVNPLLGVVEEVGELSHAYLKRQQGIRGTPEEHAAAIRDAVGDIVIFLCDFCAREGINLGNAVEDTWRKVSQRNWVKNSVSGLVLHPQPWPTGWHAEDLGKMPDGSCADNRGDGTYDVKFDGQFVKPPQ